MLKTSDNTLTEVDNGNLRPGLLVEDVVTNPIPYNFFLQSHQAIKGTARSAHYHALHDDMGLGADRLPSLTMLLCFAFGRATKGVSYVAPAYIADKLCERGTAYLRYWNDTEKEPAPHFEDLVPTEVDKNSRLKPAKLSKEELMELKGEFAKLLSQTPAVWGSNYYDGDQDEEQRLNPWDPNLDTGMFWM